MQRHSGWIHRTWLAFLTAALLACAAPAAANDLTPVTLQLKWKHQFQFAGYYAAKAKGFYEEAGLDVTLKKRALGLDTVAEVMEGRADFGVSNSELLLDYFAGKPVVALGVIFQHSANVLLTRKDANITNPEDLEGKRLMILGSPAPSIWAMLARHGITRDDLILQKNSFKVEDLVNGKTDAISAYVTNRPYTLRAAGIEPHLIHPTDYGVDYYGDLLFTSRELANTDPQLVDRFAQASYRGWKYAMENTEEIIGIIKSHYLTDKSVAQLRYEAKVMQDLILPKLIPVGTMNKTRWERIAGSFREVGMIPNTRPLDDFLYIPTAQRQRDTVTKLAPYLTMLGLMVLLATLVLLYFNRGLKKGIARRTDELTRNRESLRQVIDLMPNMINVKNREGRFLLVNRSLADSLGTSVEALTGALHSDICPDAEQLERIHNDDMEVFDNGFPMVKMEEPYLFTDGSIHWLQTTRLPYTPADSAEPAVLTLAVDITRRKQDTEALQQSQDDLRKLNEELEQRVDERTASLAAAKEKLMESLEQLKQTQEELILSEKLAALGGLVAGVAHEINTPLGVGVTASSFLNDNITDLARQFEQGELKKSDLEKFIQSGTESSRTILANLNRAAELIRSFKQVAADQSSEQSRKFNLHDYVDEVLLSLKPKYKSTGHVIENNCPDMEIDSYPGAFMQIITNLLVNALIHAYDEGDSGRIAMDGKVEGDTLSFSFRDDGKGMDNNTMDKAFEPFYTTKREKGGTGLGLHIVFNTVTQTLGGTIRMTSEPGKGTDITITMPLTKRTA